MKLKKPFFIICTVLLVLIVVTVFQFINHNRVSTEMSDNRLPTIDSIPKDDWKSLAGKKIFFGHKSVGYNIIDGVKDLIREHDYIKLNIVETSDPNAFDQPIFAHAQVGENMDPASKNTAFYDLMDSGIGDTADIAFFKYCYVDIKNHSNPEKLHDEYVTLINTLQNKFPEIAFLHLQIPICTQRKGIKIKCKSFIKSILGRPGLVDDNSKRHIYNSLVNKSYDEGSNVFNLALAEAMTADGALSFIKKDGEKVYTMVPVYSDDGGHLNEVGRRHVAEQFLITLVQLAKRIDAGGVGK